MSKRMIGVILLAGGLAMTALGCPNRSSGGGGGDDGDGHPAVAVVSGGTVMTSESYRLVLTTGQGPGGNGVLTSESYRLRGGVIGATQ